MHTMNRFYIHYPYISSIGKQQTYVLAEKQCTSSVLLATVTHQLQQCKLTSRLSQCCTAAEIHIHSVQMKKTHHLSFNQMKINLHKTFSSC